MVLSTPTVFLGSPQQPVTHLVAGQGLVCGLDEHGAGVIHCWKAENAKHSSLTFRSTKAADIALGGGDGLGAIGPLDPFGKDPTACSCPCRIRLRVCRNRIHGRSASALMLGTRRGRSTRPLRYRHGVDADSCARPRPCTRPDDKRRARHSPRLRDRCAGQRLRQREQRVLEATDLIQAECAQ